MDKSVLLIVELLNMISEVDCEDVCFYCNINTLSLIQGISDKVNTIPPPLTSYGTKWKLFGKPLKIIQGIEDYIIRIDSITCELDIKEYL